MTPEAKLEAILFFKGEALAVSDAARLLETDETAIKEIAAKLQTELAPRGLRLVVSGENMMLMTAPELAGFFEDMRKEEFSKELTKAAAETLAIVLYRGPVSRSEIDYIRGVNSAFILRNLQVRGLVEKVTKSGEERRFLYQPSVELLAHLGITGLQELPEFDKVKRELETFVSEKTEAPEGGNPEIASEQPVYDGGGESDDHN